MLVLILDLLKRIQLKLKSLITQSDDNISLLTFGLNVTENLVVPANTTLTLTAPGPGQQQKVFQYKNIIIEPGATLTCSHNPFILQASESIVVNGHLNMDGKGGPSNSRNSHSDNNYQTGALNLGTWLNLTAPSLVVGGADVTTESWKKIYTYLKSDNRLNMEFMVTGAGGGNKYSWKKHGKSRSRSHYSHGFANGAKPGNRDNLGGGAGGVLCLLYKKLMYNNKYFTINRIQYMQEIQANGGEYKRHWGQGWAGHNYGGGFMFVVAPKIEVGPAGKISCNASGDCDGSAAFLNLPAQNTSQGKLIYNGGTPVYAGGNDGRGGAGCCIGCDLGEI